MRLERVSAQLHPVAPIPVFSHVRGAPQATKLGTQIIGEFRSFGANDCSSSDLNLKSVT